MRTALLYICLVALASSAHAQVPVHGSAFVSNMRSTGDNRLLERPLRVDLAITSGPGFGVSADATFRERFVTEFRYDSLRPDVELRALGFDLDAGSLEMRVATLAVLTTIGRTDARVQPYVGLGIVHASFGNIDVGVLDFAIDEEELSIEPTFGGSVAAGLRATLSPRVMLVADARFFPVEPAIERSESFPVKIDVNPLVLSLGIRARLR